MAGAGNKRGAPAGKKETASAGKKAKPNGSTTGQDKGKGKEKGGPRGRPRKSKDTGSSGDGVDGSHGASAPGQVKTKASVPTKGAEKGSARGRPKKAVVLESAVSSVEGENENDALEALSQSQRSVDSEGMESTRQLLKELQSMVERKEKKDNFQKEFEAEIRADEKRLLGLVDELEKERQTEREAFNSEFTSLLKEALASSRVGDDGETTQASTSPHSPSSSTSTEHNDGNPLIRIPTINENPIHIASDTLMEEFQTLFSGYDELKRQTENFQPPEDFSEAWEADYAEASRLISVGKVATEAEITMLLTYRDKRDRRTREQKQEMDTKGFRKDEHLQAMLEMGREGQDSDKKVYGWANAAHRLEKGFKSLVRALPEEPEE